MTLPSKNQNCRISVRGLRTETRINDIFEIFQDFGSITFCRLITDRRNESKGYCFISYSNPEEAENALCSMNGKRFDGAVLNVVYATVQNDMKFDDPELREAKIPSSHPEGRDPPSKNNWERHFIYSREPSPASCDESNYSRYNNSLQNPSDIREFNAPPPPQSLSSNHPNQSRFPPPPSALSQQQRQNLFPPPPPPPPPSSLISQSQQKMIPPPHPLSSISQQPKQQNPIPNRSNYQQPPSHSSPSPPHSSTPQPPPPPLQQYPPPPPQIQHRQPYRIHDYHYSSQNDYNFEQEFQREYQYRTSGAVPGMNDVSRYQHYPPPEQPYNPPNGQRPAGPPYGRPPPPPYMPPPPQRPYQGNRHDRQPPPPPPPHLLPPPLPKQRDMYFEPD